MQPNLDETRIPVRQRAQVKRKTVLRTWVTTSLWVMYLAVFGVVGSLAGWLFRNTSANKVILPIIRNTPPEETFGKDVVNILLLGCDEELYYGGKQVLKRAGRADMILMARLDFKKNTITGISVPRDTRCQLPGDESHKINAYHNLAPKGQEAQAQKEAVEHLTGVKFDKVIVLDYLAFQDLIDTVGGVTVTIKDVMKYTDRAASLYIDFKPGVKKLDGYDAMCYVRFRKDKGGDFKRTERQRQLLVAFKGEVMKNWTRLPEIVAQGVKVFGKGMNEGEIAALANFSKKVPPTSIKMLRLPTGRGRGSFEELDVRGATKLLTEHGYLGTIEEPKAE
ncbi:MAG TPA: LCP family protein [Fimbriimonas sp.]|nr:LCP family protein [Fimbriimonas sp.]